MALQLIRGYAKVVVDKPTADPTIQVNGHGFGYTWRFREKDADPGDATIPWAPTWQYVVPQAEESWTTATQPTFHGATEYIAPLRAVAPRGTATRTDMALADWAQEQGTWREVVTASHPQHKFLWWAGAANDYGQIGSETDYYPNLAWWLYRFAPPWTHAGVAYTVIAFYPSSGDWQWAWYLPLNAQDTDAWKYPRLLRAPRGAQFNLGSHTVDENQSLGMYAGPAAGDSALEYVCIENVAGCWLLYWNQGTEPWVYKDSTVGVVPSGRVKLLAQGHPVSFSLAPVRYPATAACQAATSLSTPDWINPIHAFWYLGDTTAGGSVAITSGISGNNPTGQNPDVPRVTFTTTLNRRPVVYQVAQLHDPLWNEADSSPLDLSGTGTVMSLTTRHNDQWRGATCDIELRTTIDQFTWKGNNKVTVDVAWLQATDGTVTSVPNPASRQFTGYLTSLSPRKDPDDLAHVQMTLHCEDGFTGRLQGKKKMLHHACYAGVKASTALNHILNRAGVPDTLITASSFPTINLPASDRAGELTFQFGADAEVTAALDTIATALGGYIGVDQNGLYTFAYRPTYSGTPDHAIDDTATDADDLLYAVEVERGWDDFRNYVAVVCGQGAYTAEGFVRNEGSHGTSSDADFIGEDWWEVDVLPDAGTSSATLLVWQRYSELWRRRQVIRWETSGKPDLWPNHYVAVTTTGLDVPTGTVFRIVEKSSRIEPNSGEFTTSFLGIKEQ